MGEGGGLSWRLAKGDCVGRSGLLVRRGVRVVRLESGERGALVLLKLHRRR